MELNLIYTDYSNHLELLKNIFSDSRYHQKYNFNFINENDLVDMKKKYILLYPLQGQLSHLIKNNEILISEFLRKKIDEGFNIKIYFCTEAECEYEGIFDNLNEYLKQIKIPNDIVTIASGNSKLENLQQYGINCIRKYNPILSRISSTMLFVKNIDDVEWVEDKKYIFQCYNHMMIKPHRRAFLTLLEKEKLLDDIDWSSLSVQQSFELYEYGIQSFEFLKFSNDEILDLKTSHEKIINGGKSKLSEFENESMRNPYDGNPKSAEPNHNITYRENPHKNSYINIVSESQFELENTIHITEKSFVPFYFNQIPIFVATQGHVEKIKNFYGFDTFDDIIDHSYDLIENPKDRLYKIIEEVKRLNSNKNLIIDFYKNNKERFDKNRKIIQEISYKESYEIIIEDFLS